jgi:predicted  nucleic acid-binding Zn-ribbon protein
VISGPASIVHLGDLDLLLREVQDPASRGRLKKLGFEIDGVAKLDAARSKLAAGVDRRWAHLYERARQRYGRGMVAVRSRVCMGCYVTLPTTARPPQSEGLLSLCESCSRILYWG